MLALVAQQVHAQGGQGGRQNPPRTERERGAYCASLSEAKRRQTDICKTAAERDEDARAQRLKEQDERERPHHTSFLRKLYLDGLWMPTSMGAGQYGLIGTHLDLATVGRVHVFGPPGVMLVLEQTEDGWRVKPALTWGFSIYVTDVRLPGARRRAQLFFNVTKSWTGGNISVGRDMAGLSLTWKK